MPRLPPGRVLGLDAGDRRIGVAISDPDQRLAVSLSTLDRRDGGETSRLRRIAAEDEVVAVVVGLPLSLSGEKGPQAGRVEAFAREIGDSLGLPVFLWDERLTTREAEHVTGRPKPRRERRGGRHPSTSSGRSTSTHNQADTDAIAATIILQAFLDSLRRKDREPDR